MREMQVGVLLNVALFFPVGMYDAILDRYLTDRGASNVLIGISFTMYGIPFALLASRGGRLADRRGAYRLSLISIALVVPLTAAYGLLTVPVVIMVVFFIEGTVQALGVPASQAVVAEAAPLGRASAAQGLAGSMNLLAAAVSAFTAPLVYERWGAEVTFTTAADAGGGAGRCGRRAPRADAVIGERTAVGGRSGAGCVEWRPTTATFACRRRPARGRTRRRCRTLDRGLRPTGSIPNAPSGRAPMASAAMLRPTTSGVCAVSISAALVPRASTMNSVETLPGYSVTQAIPFGASSIAMSAPSRSSPALPAPYDELKW